MVGYLMALYSDYKGERGGMVEEGERQREKGGRNRKRYFNDGITQIIVAIILAYERGQ